MMMGAELLLRLIFKSEIGTEHDLREHEPFLSIYYWSALALCYHESYSLS